MARKVEEDDGLNDDKSRRATRAAIERARRAFKAVEPPNTHPPSILTNPHARALHERMNDE